MIEFKISAPNRLSLFGEYAVKYGKRGLMASMDIRTTLTFKELSNSHSSSMLQIELPSFFSFFQISLHEFQKLYDNCTENIELLREKVLQYTNDYVFPAHKTIVQILYYLLVYITYEEQIEMKPFTMHLSTKLTMAKNLIICPASFTVCIVYRNLCLLLYNL
ncbi:uncharacterized protein LOC105828662 [Monomorium pharaonis]|uniref:uncharacterized protein LOC105828662 n=1 Tax=Monomorium pharaonis TaxID=307658 RepID=UPI0017468482|nr:uncharacterized protein LOC105828662 [Monomorium pharaonis]